MKTTETKSKQREVLERDVNVVMKCLDITDEMYRNLQYDESCVYVSRKFGNDFRLVNQIALLPLFSKWWLNQWAMRERQFVRQCNLLEINEKLTGETKRCTMEIHFEIHNAKALDITMNAWVQKEIYDFIKMETNREEHNF